MVKTAVTVTQLNCYVKSILSEDKILNGIMVKGEISNFIRHYKSGHLYFTLKDSEASIKAVMFRSNAQYLRFQPENGMAIVVSGSVTLYERDGNYQLYVQDIQPDGIGALYLAFAQLKEKLSLEGLFALERKRPIPQYPEKIGIVTSSGAAALQDMLHILERRCPIVRIVLFPAQVQGEGAAKTIIQGIKSLNETDCDIIIIGRGGGSMEDLWAFNDEKLARTIVASKIPVISAVGHETDFTIADFVADLRAPTPSAAAELAVPNSSDILYYLDTLSQKLTKSIEDNINNRERYLRELYSNLFTPIGVLESYKNRLEWGSREVKIYMERTLERTAFRLKRAAELIEASSPVRLLERGYSVTLCEGKTVSTVTNVMAGDILSTRVTDGTIISRVEAITNGGLERKCLNN